MRQLLACFIAVAFFALFLQPVSAKDEWEGTWSDSPHPNSCNAERGDGYPLIIMSGERIAGYWQATEEGVQTIGAAEGQIVMDRQADPIACDITKKTNVIDLDAWILNIECGSEGYIWESRTIVMKTDLPDGLAVYNLAPEGGVKQLYGCPE